MVTYFVTFLLSLMVGAVLTLVVRNRAHALGWLDQAKSSRKVHVKPIPRLGGIAIAAATFTPLAALLVVDTGVGLLFRAQPALVWGLFTGGGVIAALGIYDDLRGADAKLKFSIQLAVAVGLYVMGFRVGVLANPFGAPVSLGPLALPFTILWMVGVVNAINLIDGLDGLAGGVAFFAVLTNFILAIARGDVLMCLVMAALGGAILGFLIFNFNPASIFMGDTGSMFLGFVLAATSLKVNTKSGTAVAMLVPIIALGLPIMDTFLAMGRRVLLGRPMFSADKEHIHHRLMSRLALRHRSAVLVLYGICCLFCLTALALSYANSAQSTMLLLAVSVVVVVLMRKLGYLNLQKAGAVQQTRRRNLQLRLVVKELSERIARAGHVHEIWEAVRPLNEALDGTKLEMRVTRPGAAEHEEMVLQTERPAGGSAFPLGARVELKHQDVLFGALTVTWRDGRDQVDRDEELALELLADFIGTSLARLEDRKSADPTRVVALRRGGPRA